MQRLALDGNQLTGTLPQVWSDSKSLSSLGKLNLVGNQLTGSIPWSTANMPDLLNLIVLPGKHSLPSFLPSSFTCRVLEANLGQQTISTKTVKSWKSVKTLSSCYHITQLHA